MTKKELNEKFEDIKNEELEEVEGYCIYTKNCKTSAKRKCETDCPFNSAVYTCEK